MMKVTYEIEFDLPDEFRVKALASLVNLIKYSVRDRLPVGSNLRVRARQVLPLGVETNHDDETLC